MTAIYYDCEFVEDGRTIDLVSIGMVCGDEFVYGIVADDDLIDRMIRHPWLSKNVLPHLPVKIAYGDGVLTAQGYEAPVKYWEWDEAHPDYLYVRPRKAIAARLRRFILSRKDPQLWAYFGAYDHIALAQLFGDMTDLPGGIPMYTNEFMQEWHRAGKPALPPRPQDAHHSLADAQWLAVAHYQLTTVKEP